MMNIDTALACVMNRSMDLPVLPSDTNDTFISDDGVSIIFNDDDLEDQVDNMNDAAERLTRNKIWRKAMQLFVVCFEAELSLLILLLEVFEDRGYQNTHCLAKALAFVSMFYVLLHMIAAPLHAARLNPKARMSTEVEKAYLMTNALPFWGTILEIQVALRFGGKVLAIALWGVYCILLVLFLVTLFTTESAKYSVPMGLAAVTMFHLSGLACEYYVCTMPQNLRVPGEQDVEEDHQSQNHVG